MKSNVGRDKSYEFALCIVRICRRLAEKEREFVLSKQLLRCGTSIGANVEEAVGGQSRRDFTAKISIAYKEAREAGYWLRLLKDSGLLIPEEYGLVSRRCEELKRILGSTVMTMQRGREWERRKMKDER